jgi:amino acid permease
MEQGVKTILTRPLPREKLAKDVELGKVIQVKRKSKVVKLFSSLKEGSVRESVFSLMSTAVGLSALALPYSLKQSGLILGTLSLILGAILCKWSMNLLVAYSFQSGFRNYHEMVNHAYGKKVSRFFQCNLILYAFGSVLNYQIIFASLCEMLLPKFGLTEHIMSSRNLRLMILGVLNALTYPVACIKNLHGLRYASVWTVVSISAAMLLVIIQCPIYAQQNFSTHHLDLANWDLNLFNTFSVTIFAYNCHTNFCHVMRTLRKPTPERMLRISSISLIGDFAIFAGIAVSGYLSTFEQTPKLIILRPPSELDPTDIAMTVIQTAIVISIIFAIPIRLYPCRTEILTLANKLHLENHTIKRSLVTMALLWSAGVIAFFFPDIYASYTLITGTASIFISIVFPGLLGIKLAETKGKAVLIWIIVLGSLGIGLTAATITFLRLIGSIH